MVGQGNGHRLIALRPLQLPREPEPSRSHRVGGLQRASHDLVREEHRRGTTTRRDPLTTSLSPPFGSPERR